MSERHLIESAVLNISYANEELALSQNSELETFAKSRFLEIVGEVFDEISGPDTVLYFDKLEIDLGEISLAYFFDDFGVRLKEKVRETLEHEILQYQINATENHYQKPVKRSEFDVLCQFLATGRLPWNANFTQRNDVEKLLHKNIANNSSELIAFIRGINDRNEMLNRLCSQFQPDLLCQLLGVVGNVPQNELHDVVDQFLVVTSKHFGVQRREIEDRVWVGLFQFALLNQSRVYGVKDYLACVVRAVSLHVPQSYPVFLDRIVQFLKREGNQGQLLTFVGEMASEFYSKESRSLNFSELKIALGRSEGEQSRSVLLSNRARLIESLNTGSTTSLVPIWQSLLSNYPLMLKQVITTLGQDVQVRRKIARNFQEYMIQDIVELIEPLSYKFVEQLVNEPKITLLADEELHMQKTDARKSLWEFTLTYLLVERGSRFNRKSYIASMMIKMASHLNINPGDLYQSLIAMLQLVAKNDSMRSEILTLLVELGSEFGDGKRVASIENRNNTYSGHESAAQLQDNQPDKLNLYFTIEADQPPTVEAVEALNLAFSGKGLSELKLVWKLLLSRHGIWFASTLRKAAQSALVRQNIAKSFSNLMFKELICLLEPSNGKFVTEVVHRTTMLALKDGKRLEVPQKTKRIVREFTLTYLLVERGSRFNKKTYLAGILKKMAAHENISLQSLYRSIRDSIQSVSFMKPLQKEILLLLNDVAMELRISNTPEKQSPQRKPELGLASSQGDRFASKLSSSKGQLRSAGDDKELEQLELIRAYLLYEKLVIAVGEAANTVGNISYHVVRLIHELIENYPWILHRFNQDVNSGELVLSPLVSKLPKALQRKLVICFFSSFADKYPFEKAEFVTRLEETEARNSKTGQFYAVILESLIGNRVMGIDEIFNDTSLDRTSLENTKELGASDITVKRLIALRTHHFSVGLMTIARGAGSAVADFTVAEMRQIEEMIRRFPEILKQFEQDRKSGLLSLSPLITQLPKDLQRKLLLVCISGLREKCQFDFSQFIVKLKQTESVSSINSNFYSSILDALLNSKLLELDGIFRTRKSTLALSQNALKQSEAGVLERQAIQQKEIMDSQARLRDSAPLSLNRETYDTIRSHLLGQLKLAEQDKMMIVSTLELFLSTQPSVLTQLLRESLLDKSGSDRLVSILPESLLAKLMLLLRPDEYFRVILYADLMTMAAVEIDSSTASISRLLHLSKWQFIFDYMVIEGRKFSEISFVKLYIEYLGKRSPIKTQPEFIDQLAASIRSISSPVTHVAAVRIAMILSSDSAFGQENFKPGLSLKSSAPANVEKGGYSLLDADLAVGALDESRDATFDTYEEDIDSKIDEDIYIDNAGLILLAPYLPRYFEMLDLLKDNKFKSRAAAERGIHLLQFLLNSRTDSFEYELVLNKVLCGVEAGKPIVKSIEITDKEVEASEGLLKGVVANWPILKNTSIDGLRESFLQREAHLQLKNDSWQLLVQSKAFDMLMDSIPWSFSTIKLGWMKRPIHVEWR